MQDKNSILVIGNDARANAIVEALARSKPTPNIFAWMEMMNPGIRQLADVVRIGGSAESILDFAKESQVLWAIISPEKYLASAVADALETMDVHTVGPLQRLARLETSKGYTRGLMKEYHVSGNVEYRKFKIMDGIEAYLEKNMPTGVVIKPDGLTGGKGVKVQSEHFNAIAQALAICEGILAEHEAVIIEEKLEGEEFSLQCPIEKERKR
ncbi:MAG: hypothetical protein Q8O93_00915 [bacterium]|nr:hypothetical protein [bacterium]